MKKVLVLAAAMAVGSTAFAFSKGQTDAQVAAETATRVAIGESIESISRDASAAEVSLTAVQGALVAAGKDSTAVFNSLVAVGADPTRLTPPTAAGNPVTAAGGASGNNNAGGSLNGLTNSAFGQSRATTVGGGGRTSVSPS